MTLGTRLLLAFGLVATLATAAVGLSMRRAAREILEADFDDRIEAAYRGASQELSSEVGELRDLLGPLCAHDTFVDRAHLELERARGDAAAIDSGARIAMRYQVPEQARALGLDELTLVAGDGTLLGSTDVTRIGAKEPRLAALVGSKKKLEAPRLAAGVDGQSPSIEVYCTLERGGVRVGLVGARRIAPLLQRIGDAYGVRLVALEGKASVPPSNDAEVVRELRFGQPEGLRLAATVSRVRLTEGLARLDAAALASGVTTLMVALAIAVLIARSLTRPIVALAKETREVVGGEPRPVTARGGRELEELAASFNRTIDELTAMRRRVAATERIAARREVARKVAHEIKNPLAPIRAAVETLRRLRARDDPAFDDYFDEATRTVLDEVHRIAHIVQEFTKFSRLPPPSPERLDLAAVAQRVVALHASSVEATAPASGPRVELQAEPVPEVLADRDQLIQVLTNLVQNGLEAASAVRRDPRVVVTLGPAGADKVRIVVRDNGPGVSKEMLPRLFEPYATSKDKGTGLGLAIVQRIVFEHGGEITYREATKGGAVFEVVLPVEGPPLLEKPPSMDVTGTEASRSPP